MRLFFRSIITILVFFTLEAESFNYVNLTQINTDQGLNQSEISRILQDKDGYLWVSSLQGINRYDGYRMVTIPSVDDILTNNYVELLFEDSHGLIWIGTEPDRNFVLNKETNQLIALNLTTPESYDFKEPVLNQAVEDEEGNLWLATYNEIFYYDRNSDKIHYVTTTDKMFGSNDRTHFIRDLLYRDQLLLVATTIGLFSLDTESKKIQRLSHTPNKTVTEDQNNVKELTFNLQQKLMVGTVEGLFEIDFDARITNLKAAQFETREIVQQLNIWKIIEKKNFYWLATDKGLYQLSKMGELTFRFRFSDTKYNTNDDDIVAMLEDREGNLWLGSRGDGLFKWHPNNAVKAHFWNTNPDQSRLSHNYISSILQTPDKSVWIGTQNGINRLNLQDGNIRQFMVNPDEKAVVSDSTVYGLHLNENKLWIDADGALRVFDLEKLNFSSTTFPEKLKELFKKEVLSIRFFDRNNLAILTLHGMYNYNLKKNEITFIESTQTNGEDSAALAYIFTTPTNDSNTFFAAGSDRLVKFNRDTGEIHDFHQLPASETVRSQPADIFRDQNHLWVTYTGYGIYLLDATTGKEIEFFSEKSLGANTLMDIIPDNYGNLWFTSNGGLLKMNKQTFHRQLFDSRDGFITSEFNGGTKIRLDNGNFLIGSVKGVFQLNPDDFPKNQSFTVKNHITNLTLMSKTIPHQFGNYNNITQQFDHDDFGLKIEFSPLLLGRPEQIRYRYWIEGDSAIEPKIIDESELFLPTFKPGKSTVKISAFDYRTGLESPPASISLVVAPAPWFSIYAFLAYALFLIVTSYLFYNNARVRALAKERSHQKLIQNEERLSLALRGGNSGLWDWHAQNDLVYEPRLAKDENSEKIFSFTERLEAIHPEDRLQYTESWLRFIFHGKDEFNQVYRMRNQQDIWLWYRDIARVTRRNENDFPIRVTGTFTNITNRKRDRDQMRLYSNAFENTRDIVFVLDQNKNVIAANQSFYKTTSTTSEIIIDNAVDFIIDNDGDAGILRRIFKTIDTGSHWEGEGNLLRQHKKPLPVLINATGFATANNIENYVIALTDISSQKSAEAALRKLASYDNLTGLPNRTLLIDRISHAIQHCRRRHQQIALFFVDLDRFKRINDTLGHDIGDILLSRVAEILKKSVREDDTVARLGGDEFVVMLEYVDGVDSVNHIAQSILEKMQKPFILNENQVSISPSIGIALYPGDGEHADILLKHADIAMYHAKKVGRNNFQYFENSMNKSARSRLNLENRLREALFNDEIYLEYQPQYDLATGQIRGMEALARWKTSDGKQISPGEFIPLAEELGLIISLSEKLLTKAIANLSRWHALGFEIALAFNLSARHLHHYDLNLFLDELLQQYPIKTELLEFELTESVLMEDIKRAQILFERLAEKGIELALDDFGTGYSSLKYLSQLPIKKLKIDRSFVSQIGSSHQSEAIIKTIITLASSLNLKSIAEGIETSAQLEFLRQAGARDGQGFLLSKPLALSDLDALLNKSFSASILDNHNS